MLVVSFMTPLVPQVLLATVIILQLIAPLRGLYLLQMRSSSGVEGQSWPTAPPLRRLLVWVNTPQQALQPHAQQALLSSLYKMQIGTWDTGVLVHHLNSNATNLSTLFNSCMYPSVLVGDGKSIPVTNTGHSTLPTPYRPLHLNNVLITPNIVKNLIRSTKFVRDNKCTIEFDEFGFSVKDYWTRQILLRCDSTVPQLGQPTSSLTTAHIPLLPLHWPPTNQPTNHSTLQPTPSAPTNPTPMTNLPLTISIPPTPPPVPSPATTQPNCNLASTHSMVTRYRVGTNRPTQRYTLSVSTISPIPKSYNHAFQDPHWYRAMLDEYNALIKNNTWILVPRPSDANIVRSLWLFRHKYNADDTLNRYKARLVANDSTQLTGIDVDETFSPVIKSATIRTVLSLALFRHWPVHQLDVNNAFLHGGSDTAYLLLKVDRHYIELLLHSYSSEYFATLHVASLSMTDLGPLNYFLGISVTRNTSRMFLSQQKYASELLERAGMLTCNPCRTLVDTDSKLSADGDPVSDPTLYRSLAGAHQVFDFTRPIYLTCAAGLSLHQLVDAPLHVGLPPVIVFFLATIYFRGLQRDKLPLSPLQQSKVLFIVSSNPCNINCTKHIEIDIHCVRDLVVAGHIRVLHVPSRYQYADIFTKGLPTVLFDEFRSSLSVRSSPAQTAGGC
ncbi:ribonuclease H-like domain-containing protein [Tanacetum coccineum]